VRAYLCELLTGCITSRHNLQLRYSSWSVSVSTYQHWMLVFVAR